MATDFEDADLGLDKTHPSFAGHQFDPFSIESTQKKIYPFGSFEARRFFLQHIDFVPEDREDVLVISLGQLCPCSLLRQLLQVFDSLHSLEVDMQRGCELTHLLLCELLFLEQSIELSGKRGDHCPHTGIHVSGDGPCGGSEVEVEIVEDGQDLLAEQLLELNALALAVIDDGVEPLIKSSIELVFLCDLLSIDHGAPQALHLSLQLLNALPQPSYLEIRVYLLVLHADDRLFLLVEGRIIAVPGLRALRAAAQKQFTLHKAGDLLLKDLESS